MQVQFILEQWATSETPHNYNATKMKGLLLCYSGKLQTGTTVVLQNCHEFGDHWFRVKQSLEYLGKA